MSRESALTETTTPMPPADDFLDLGVYGEPVAPSGSTGDAPSDGGAGRVARRRHAAAAPLGWLVAGLAVGALAVTAWHSGQSSSPVTAPAAAQGQLPGGPPNAARQPNGQPPAGGFGGGFGGRTGEQRVSGTVTAVGSASVTVRLASSTTATYAVVASSDIVKNGVPVPLSAITAGDRVFLHVYPQGGQTVVEHLFAGAPPAGGPGAGQQPTDTTTTTTT